MMEEVLRRTLLAIMVWVYNHPNQSEAVKTIRSLPDSFEEQLPILRDLGIVTHKTYGDLL